MSGSDDTAASDLLGVLNDPGTTLALLGAIDNDTGSEPAFHSPAASIDPASLPDALRVDLAIVRPRRGEDLRALGRTLARLRDVHARRVLCCTDEVPGLTTVDLVALGFEPLEHPSVDGRLYLWDPALADQPREWNDSSNWANPENFSKFRW